LKLHATLCRYFRIPGFRPPPQYFSCLPRTYHHESTTIPTTVTPMRHQSLPGLQPLDGVCHNGESSGEHPP
jgi:hypothetical protein